MATVLTSALIRATTGCAGDVVAQHIRQLRQKAGDLPPGRPGRTEQQMFCCAAPPDDDDARAAAVEADDDGGGGVPAADESPPPAAGGADDDDGGAAGGGDAAGPTSPATAPSSAGTRGGPPMCELPDNPCDDFSALRSTRMALVGLLYVGPMDYFWYHFQAANFPGHTLGMVLKKLAVDQLLFSPFTNTMYLCCNAGLRTASCAAILKRWTDAFCVVQSVNYMFFTPTLFLSYMFVPVDKQVIVMSAVGFCFTVFEATVANRPLRKGRGGEMECQPECGGGDEAGDWDREEDIDKWREEHGVSPVDAEWAKTPPTSPVGADEAPPGVYDAPPGARKRGGCDCGGGCTVQ